MICFCLVPPPPSSSLHKQRAQTKNDMKKWKAITTIWQNDDWMRAQRARAREKRTFCKCKERICSLQVNSADSIIFFCQSFSFISWLFGVLFISLIGILFFTSESIYLRRLRFKTCSFRFIFFFFIFRQGRKHMCGQITMKWIYMLSVHVRFSFDSFVGVEWRRLASLQLEPASAAALHFLYLTVV